jgi:hypothetical protein
LPLTVRAEQITRQTFGAGIKKIQSRVGNAVMQR